MVVFDVARMVRPSHSRRDELHSCCTRQFTSFLRPMLMPFGQFAFVAVLQAAKVELIFMVAHARCAWMK